MTYAYRYTLLAVSEETGKIQPIASFMDRAMMLSAARYQFNKGGWSDFIVIERKAATITLNRLLFDDVTFESI